MAPVKVRGQLHTKVGVVVSVCQLNSCDGVGEAVGRLLSGDSKDMALCSVEVHLPVHLPSAKLRQISLQLLSVVSGIDDPIQQAVICKEPDAGASLSIDVINVHNEH